MDKISRKIFAFFEGVCRLVWSQLPMFVMLTAFMSVPACFDGFQLGALLKSVLPQTILISLLLCWVASKKRWIWYTIFVVANFLFFVELGCFFCQHTRFKSVIAILMLQSNVAESKEFINFAMVPIAKAAVCSVVIAALLLLWNTKWKHCRIIKLKQLGGASYKLTVYIIGALLTLSIVYTPLRIRKCLTTYDRYWKRMKPMADANTPLVYYFAIQDSFFNPEMQEIDKLAQTIANTEINDTDAKDELQIVYVIGESFGRGRSSLYGYPMDNNPLMAAELSDSSLIIYDNVITPSARTIDVYRYLLSTCDVLGDKGFVDYPLLPSVLKKGGYHVSYFDNQSLLNSAKFDFGCTFFLSNYDVQKQSINDYNSVSGTHDGILVSANPPHTDLPRNLTIYHLLGQHVDFEQRYPAEFRKFSAKDYAKFGYYTDEQAKMVAEYDNATLYNDYILSQIIDKLRDDVAIMVYAPDHGEEVYDYRDNMGREINVPDESIRVLFEVPVMIWVSDKFKELYPEEVSQLRANTHKAIYNTDLPHTILDVAGIGTESFRPDLSLLRDGEGRIDRRILQNNYDYDANRDKIRGVRMRYEK